MKIRLQGFTLFFCFSMIANSQNDALKISMENFVVNKDTIHFHHYSPMKNILPNRPIHIIVSDFEDISDDKIQKEYKGLRSFEKWNLVYLELSREKINIKVLRVCLEELFYKFYYDRNRVHLSIKETIDLKDSKDLDAFLKNIASMWIDPSTYASYSGTRANVYTTNPTNFPEVAQKLKSENIYEPVTIKETESLTQFKKRLDSYLETKGKHLISITNGFFQVVKGRAVAFDEETLVDLRSFNSLWTLSYDYMITERMGVGLIFGFIAKKDGSSENIINGSVSGGAITKLGLSTRYLVYKTRRFHLYPAISIGNLAAKIGGGSATFQSSQFGTTIAIDSEQGSQKSIFLEFGIGADYRLGKNILLRGNIVHSQSSFNEDFGSISGFSGTGFNIGFGFVF